MKKYLFFVKIENFKTRFPICEIRVRRVSFSVFSFFFWLEAGESFSAFGRRPWPRSLPRRCAAHSYPGQRPQQRWPGQRLLKTHLCFEILFLSTGHRPPFTDGLSYMICMLCNNYFLILNYVRLNWTICISNSWQRFCLLCRKYMQSKIMFPH